MVPLLTALSPPTGPPLRAPLIVLICPSPYAAKDCRPSVSPELVAVDVESRTCRNVKRSNVLGFGSGLLRSLYVIGGRRNDGDASSGAVLLSADGCLLCCCGLAMNRPLFWCSCGDWIRLS